jgi:hypothetical protein
LYNRDRRRDNSGFQPQPARQEETDDSAIDDPVLILKEAAMFYPKLAEEIDQLIQALDEKIEALHALEIDQEEDMKEWDTRVELINRIRLFKKDLLRIKEGF